MVEEVEVWADDLMDRKPSAEFLTKYLLNNSHVKVLNVNSPWGAGKSYFLDRWAKMLSKEHVCIRFNAWETDYSTEPLLALITCMETQLTQLADAHVAEKTKSVLERSSILLKKAAPLIAKGLVKKISGVELDELLVTGAEDALDGVIGSLIEDQANTKDNVGEFKVEVHRRLQQVAKDKGLESPAFIFIDELDRCRPTYAIELLERIKHFFELEGCRFIIASDSVQLAHSIRAVYGTGFASERYLNRFFDAEFNLNNDDIFRLVHTILPEISSLNLGVNVSGDVSSRFSYSRDGREPRYPQKNTVISDLPGYREDDIIIVGLARYFDVALRELVNYVRQIKSASDALGGTIDFFWLAFLVFYKNSKSDTYQDFFDKEKGVRALQDFDQSRATIVTFSFTFSLVTVKDIASYYMTLLNADRDQLRSLSEGAEGWRSNIYYGCVNDMSRLASYKNIVELAHRLK